jgi:hypothetical protein
LPAGGGGRPSAAAIAHPWTAASIAAGFVFIAWFGLVLLHGQLDGKAIAIGIAATAMVFLAFGLLISAYRWTGS